MSDKTEAPTSRRLEEAREEGQVVRSQELISAVVILMSAFLLQGPGKQLAVAFQEVITNVIAELPTVNLSVEWLRGTIFTFGLQILPPFSLILVGLLLAGALADAGWISILWGGFFLAKTLILGLAFPVFGKWVSLMVRRLYAALFDCGPSAWRDKPAATPAN